MPRIDHSTTTRTHVAATRKVEHSGLLVVKQ
jgi:hypothetical protein